MASAGRIRVGLSGWSYRSWHGLFYPAEMPKKRQLEHASSLFDTLEVNGSFYGLIKPDTWADWHVRTPRGFTFAVKGSRFITHNKKLRDCEIPLANFFASGVLRLGDKLGPFVWQLPKQIDFDADRIRTFLALLPRDTHEAARLARKHDFRMEGRSWTRAGTKRRLRHALEVRNETYRVTELVDVVRSAGVALAVSDAADWPLFEEVTAGFVYVRLHGSEKTYGSSYTDEELDVWADKLTAWNAGEEPDGSARITERAAPRRKSRDVFVYFDNDWHANAPKDALRLLERIRAREARPAQARRAPASRAFVRRPPMRSSRAQTRGRADGQRRNTSAGADA